MGADLNSVGHSPTIWHRDNGKENGNYIAYWGCISYIGIMEKKMETITFSGCIYWGYDSDKGIDYTGLYTASIPSLYPNSRFALKPGASRASSGRHDPWAG